MRAVTWILTAVLTVCPVTAAASSPEASPPLRLDVRARRTTPGEPVRVIVIAAQPLRSVSARFFDQEVFLARENSPVEGAAEAWSGWAVIPLDRKPGPAVVLVRGETEAGREVSARLSLRVRTWKFPVQRLRVEQRYVTPPEEEVPRIEKERERLDALYALRSPGPPPTGPFVRPVAGEFLSPYGARRILNGKPRAAHPGLDLRASTGTPVAASGPGRVALAEDLYFSGKTVILDHGAGLFTVYAHLSEVRVHEGEDVAAAQIVGLSGATGRVTGPHLHWGAKVGEHPFDPSALLDPSLFR